MKVFLGVDHKGVIFKEMINTYLRNKDIEVINCKIENNPDDDHNDFALEVCSGVLENNGSFGILVCSTGIGMSIDANKIKGIYCAKVDDVDDAYYSRLHNGANVLALGIKHSEEEVKEIIDTFLKTAVSNEERYLKRIEKVKKLENNA